MALNAIGQTNNVRWRYILYREVVSPRDLRSMNSENVLLGLSAPVICIEASSKPVRLVSAVHEANAGVCHQPNYLQCFEMPSL
jgi:hypothetical protein